mgnify:CR=1 FL=1
MKKIELSVDCFDNYLAIDWFRIIGEVDADGNFSPSKNDGWEGENYNGSGPDADRNDLYDFSCDVCDKVDAVDLDSICSAADWREAAAHPDWTKDIPVDLDDDSYWRAKVYLCVYDDGERRKHMRLTLASAFSAPPKKIMRLLADDFLQAVKEGKVIRSQRYYDYQEWQHPCGLWCRIGLDEDLGFFAEVRDPYFPGKNLAKGGFAYTNRSDEALVRDFLRGC